MSEIYLSILVTTYNIEAYNFAISQLLGGNDVIHSKTK